MFGTRPLIVEEAFERVVRGAGGLLVSDILPNLPNMPENADYVFREHGVIAELKRLVKDQREDGVQREQLSKLYHRWVSEGKKVPIICGRGTLNPMDLPEECAHEMMSLLEKPLRTRIKKANSQIKTTKNILDMPDAIGLLLLAYDGDYSLNPDTLLNFSSKILNGSTLSSVDNVIIFNVGVPVSKPNQQLKYMIFGHCHRREDRIIPDALNGSLRELWGAEIRAAYGSMPGIVVPTSDHRNFIGDLYFPRTPK